MLLIFDCDGTLVDSEVISLEVISQMMGEWGYPMDVEACLAAFLGRRGADNVKTIERLMGRPLPDEAEALMRERMLARLRVELQPVAGMAETLKRLPHPRCVASSSSLPRIKESLEKTGLAPFFGGHIFSASQVAHGKPAPDLFLFAAKQMGMTPQDGVVIEDSIAGVEAGVAAHMRVIGFNGASHARAHHAEGLRAAGAHVVISAMKDLPDVLPDLVSTRAK